MAKSKHNQDHQSSTDHSHDDEDSLILGKTYDEQSKAALEAFETMSYFEGNQGDELKDKEVHSGGDSRLRELDTLIWQIVYRRDNDYTPEQLADNQTKLKRIESLLDDLSEAVLSLQLRADSETDREKGGIYTSYLSALHHLAKYQSLDKYKEITAPAIVNGFETMLKLEKSTQKSRIQDYTLYRYDPCLLNIIFFIGFDYQLFQDSQLWKNELSKYFEAYLTDIHTKLASKK